jgi:hypothetical protein
MKYMMILISMNNVKMNTYVIIAVLSVIGVYVVEYLLQIEYFIYLTVMIIHIVQVIVDMLINTA